MEKVLTTLKNVCMNLVSKYFSRKYSIQIEVKCKKKKRYEVENLIYGKKLY